MTTITHRLNGHVGLTACLAAAALATAPACGDVEAGPPDAAPGAAPDARPVPTDAATCQPSLRLKGSFQVNQITGTSPSPLDVLLGHGNGFEVMFTTPELWHPDPTNEQRRLVAVRPGSWSIDFSGTDGNLLDGDVGQYLSESGGSVPGSPFIVSAEPGGDEYFELVLMPANPAAHPYLLVTCEMSGSVVDDDGYPIVAHSAFRTCTATFGDRRGAMPRNLIADGFAAVELDYLPCP